MRHTVVVARVAANILPSTVRAAGVSYLEPRSDPREVSAPGERIDASDRLVEAAETCGSEQLTDLLSDHDEVGGDRVGRPRELLAQIEALGRDTDRARVTVTCARLPTRGRICQKRTYQT